MKVKMKMKNLTLLLMVFTGILLSTACTSEPEPITTRRFRQQKQSNAFPKLKDYSLLLSLISSRREFYAGEKRAYFIFSLKNTGLKPIILREWHTIEAANVNLYYRPGSPEDKNNTAPWQFSPGVPPGTRNLENRSALILNPGHNQAMIQVPAHFIKELKTPGKGKTPYTLRAVLNLQSVTVESAPVEIFIK